MAEFVRICPRCGSDNPEYENTCQQCDYFIGMETPVAKTSDSAIVFEEASKSEPKLESDLEPVVDTVNPSSAMTSQTALYLESVATGRKFAVEDQWIIGQQHDTNTAQIQLAQIEGVNFVHRQHCQFFYQQNQWWVKSIDQKQHGRDFTNPTFLNQKPLTLEQQTVLHNGDILALAGVALMVRII